MSSVIMRCSWSADLQWLSTTLCVGETQVTDLKSLRGVGTFSSPRGPKARCRRLIRRSLAAL